MPNVRGYWSRNSDHMKAKDRKDKIEQVLKQAQKADVTPEEAQRAWHRLCRELSHMTEPEARMPRFNGLLRSIWVAATNEQS